MAKKIQGIIVEIGGSTVGLDKAFSDINKKSRNLQSELKEIDRLLKLDPKNTELLAQKQKLLGESIENTEDKLQGLREAQDRTTKAFENGEIGEEQYRKYQREIAKTEQELNSLKSQAQTTASGVGEVGDEGQKANANLDFDTSSLEKVDSVANKAAVGLTAVGVAAIGSATETREYREDINRLNTAFEQSGKTTEQAQAAYDGFYGILGESDRAIEAVNHLALLTNNEKELVQWTDICAGVSTTFGDSLPIEGLTEAANETAKVGAVTGPLADALNWAGISEEEFNKQLSACNSEQERSTLITETLTGKYKSAGDQFQATNADIIASRDAQSGLQDTIAKVGATVEPIITKVVGHITNLISWLLENKEVVIAVVAAIGTFIAALKLFAIISTIVGFIKAWTLATQGMTLAQKLLNLVMMANPIMWIVGLIAALVGAFIYLWNTSEGFRNFWIGLWDNIKIVFSAVWNWIGNFFTVTIPGWINSIMAVFQNLSNWIGSVFLTDWTTKLGFLGAPINAVLHTISGVWNGIKSVFSGIIDFVVGVFTGNWGRAWEGVKSIFSGVFNALKAIALAPLNAIIGLVNGCITGLNALIKGLNKISFDIPDWVPGLGGKKFGINIPNIPKIPYLAKGGVLHEGQAIVAEAGPELITMMNGKTIVKPLSGNSRNTAVGGGDTIIINSPKALNPSETARQIRNTKHMIARKA